MKLQLRDRPLNKLFFQRFEIFTVTRNRKIKEWFWKAGMGKLENLRNKKIKFFKENFIFTKLKNNFNLQNL